MNDWLRFKLLILFLAPCSHVIAHDQIPGPPQDRPILLVGATLHVTEDGEASVGELLFSEGEITAIGPNVDPPENAQRIEAEGLHVYPGLIESMTDLGLREISAVDATIDRTERGERNPNVRSWIAVNPDSELIPVARAGGVLTAHVSPGGRFLRGQSAVMSLDGWTPRDMVVQAPATLAVSGAYLLPRGDDDAETAERRRERWDKFAEQLDSARRYREAKKAAISAGHADHFPTDTRRESLLPVIDRQIPLLIQADRQAAIESAVAFAVRQDLDLIIYGGYDAGDCGALLVKHDVPVIVAATYRLPMRRDDAYDAAYTLPARLSEAGVRFAISGQGLGGPGGAAAVRNLPYHAAVAVAYGLDPDVAVDAITRMPAEILGVGDRLGSLAVGKDATIIVTDGDILQTASHVTHAFIEGRRVDLGSRHKTLYKKYREKYQAETR